MRQKNRTIVSAVLVSKDKKVLLGKVRTGGVYPDCWHIPGGGVEEGEDMVSALVREIREEIGLDIRTESMKLISDSDTGEAIKTDKDTGEKWLVKMSFNVYQIEFEKNAKDIQISLNDERI
jgi:8-oxo-dGTP pyrophosphatase MutT (NUDIX family)